LETLNSWQGLSSTLSALAAISNHSQDFKEGRWGIPVDEAATSIGILTLTNPKQK
jgi:hypothetical protein